MYHGILIDQEFTNPQFPEKFKVFATKQDGSWKLYGIEIEDDDLEKVIKDIQDNLKGSDYWYAHFYNDEELIVVFKTKVFRVKPHKSTWTEVFNYGKSLKIPEDQLTFWPNRFQDERHYFI